jgi:hypothetical protein
VLAGPLSISSLESAVARLVDGLCHGSLLSQVEDAPTNKSAIRQVCEAYSTIDYEMEDDVNQSPVSLGAIGVKANTPRIRSTCSKFSKGRSQIPCECGT